MKTSLIGYFFQTVYLANLNVGLLFPMNYQVIGLVLKIPQHGKKCAIINYTIEINCLIVEIFLRQGVNN